jgi:hypothetical protein
MALAGAREMLEYGEATSMTSSSDGDIDMFVDTEEDDKRALYAKICGVIYGNPTWKTCLAELDKIKDELDNDSAIMILIDRNYFRLYEWCYANLSRFQHMAYFYAYKTYGKSKLYSWVTTRGIAMSRLDMPLLGAIHSESNASLCKYFEDFAVTMIDDRMIIEIFRMENLVMIREIIGMVKSFSPEVKDWIAAHSDDPAKHLVSCYASS